MSAGDFGLTRINGAAGAAIRLGQWLNGDSFVDYEHAFIALDDGTLLEAEPGGARIRPITDYPRAIYSGWTLTSDQRAAIVAQARTLIGVPYSAADYLALAAHRLGVPVPGLRHYIGDSGHMICSQLVDEVYWSAGLHMFTDHRWPGYVTPAALMRVLEGPQ